MLKAMTKAISLFMAAMAGSVTIASAACPWTPATRGTVKFFTGHYVQSPDVSTAVINEIRNNPGVRGVMKRYAWRDLEIARDNYDGFNRILDDMRDLKAVNKKLVVFVQFKYASPPAYLQGMVGDGYRHEITSDAPHADGWVAAFNQPIVRDRFIKMLQALAARIDTDPGLAGIVFNETATSTSISGAVRDAYYQNLMKVDQAASCTFRRTPVIQFTNFMGPYKSLFSSSYLAGQVGVGGPDVLMNDPALDAPGKSYEFIRQHSNALPVGMNVAGGNYWYNNRDEFQNGIHDRTEAPQRIQNIANYARNNLNPNFMFWYRYNEIPSYPYYNAFLAKAASGAISSATDSSCPSAYSSCSN